MGCEWMGFCALEQEAQAAWAQALLSVLAIGVAVYLPHRDRTSELRRRLDVYCALFGTMHDQARRDADILRNAIALQATAERNTGGWERLAQSMGSVALHEVPDHRLVLLLTYATELAHVAGQAWERGRVNTLVQPVRETALRELDKTATSMGRVYDEAVAIRNELGSATWMGAIRYRIFRLRKWWRERREEAAEAKGNRPPAA